MSEGVRRAGHKAVCGLLCSVVNLVFPDECRICSEPLREVSRIPVCSRCLKGPEPLHAEFFCVACRTPFVNRHPLDETGRCALCRLGLNGFDAVYSFGAYDGTLRKLIHLFKFQGVRPLRKVFGGFLAQALPREQRFDAIVAMPLHWRRRWQRGFNLSTEKECARRVPGEGPAGWNAHPAGG
jgi:predicted amidophosphoribosyltransferase